MKELTIEQKAQRYDEALERVKSWHIDAQIDFKKSLETLFPELKEGDDWQIRKEIVSAINIYCSEYHRGTKVRNDMLAWLEKQGEKNPAIYDSDVLEKHITKDSISELANSILIRNGWKVIEQKSAWSEEDKYNHHIILALLNNECVGCADKRIAIDWFNSLKDRYTWKPSDEQITWLYRAADDASKDSRMKQILNELLSDLKKLREE